MAQVTKRDYRFDNLKSLMIIGIVLEHSLLVYGYPKNFEMIWALLISPLMPLFTIISGYFYKKHTLRKLSERYLYPMLLFSAVNFIIGYIFYPPYKNGTNGFVGYAMWYLWALFVFSLITPPILKHVDLKLMIFGSLCVVFLYMLAPMPEKADFVSQKMQLNRLVGFYPFYLVGIFLKKYCNKTNMKQWKIVLAIAIISYLILCKMIDGLAYSSGFYLTFSSSVTAIARFAVSYICITFISIALICCTPNRFCVLSEWGQRTMTVYLLHMLVVFPVCHGIFSRFPMQTPYVQLNSLIPCGICLLLFSSRISRLVSYIMRKQLWTFVILLYMISVCLVNSSGIMFLIDKAR